MFMLGVWILWSKKKIAIIFQKENGNTFILLIIFIVKSLQKSKIAQIYYYDPQSAIINLQSPQSDSIPWTLTLCNSLCSVHLFSSQHTAQCETKTNIYYIFNLLCMYILFHHSLNSQKLQSTRLRISEIVYFYGYPIFIYFFTLTVSVWRLVFGTPASLNLARLL